MGNSFFIVGKAVIQERAEQSCLVFATKIYAFL